MTRHALDRRSTQRRLVVAVALPLLLLALLAASLLGLVAYLRVVARAEDHTDAVLAQATGMTTLLGDQEAGLRGYILTNEPDSLASYERAAPNIEQAFATLKAMATEEPLQQQRLASLEQELQNWQAYAATALAIKRAGGASDAAFHRAGTRNLAAIRAELAAFTASEEQQRAQHTARANQATNVVVATSLLGSTLLGVVLALSARRLVRATVDESTAALSASQERAQALQTSANRLHDLFERAPMGIVLARNEQVLAANRAFMAMFGYDQAKPVVGLPWSRFVTPADNQPLQALARQPLEANEAKAVDSLGVRANGELFPFRMRVAQIQFGASMAEVAYIADQTAQRQLEQQVLRMQKLESMGRLAGGIAHDFNNLLTVITSAVDLAESTLAANRTALADLMLIRQTVDRGSALTRQLLAVASRQPNQLTTVDLNQLIRELEPLLHLLLGNHIQVDMAMDPLLWPIEADPVQIEQVLLNLVVNARDAMPGGGQIMIETTNVVVDSGVAQPNMPMTGGSYVRLAVRDTGTGMSEETQARLFEPFFTTKGPEQGTGLGLATTYGIVTQHRGSITVASELDHGTTFEIYLPTAASTEARAIGVGERMKNEG